MTAAVFDAGGLISLEKGDRRMIAVADAVVNSRVSAYVPAGVVAQVWRGTPRQHDIAVLLRSEAVRVVPLDEGTARKIGLLLGASGQSDVTDAHVAYLAASLGNAVVYTSDAADITAINPSLAIVPV